MLSRYSYLELYEQTPVKRHGDIKVVGDKILVLQGWLTTGARAKPHWMSGFKYGILDKIEVGLDSKLGSGGAGPIAFQAKLKLAEFDFGFAALVGAEGIAVSTDIGDKITPYAVVSQDIDFPEHFKLFRITGGYNFQKDNFAIFGGIDRVFKLFGEELIIRGDLKQVNDGRDLLASGGFLLTLPFNLELEAWLSVPTESKTRESVTVKLDYVINF